MHNLLLALAAFCLLGSSTAHAETADREKPIQIQAHRFHGDEIKGLVVYTGAVEVHQGTLEILGDKLTLTISPEGYRTMTVVGNPVRMKERRDAQSPGVDEWVHASSLTAVYDEKKDEITLTNVAKLARSENGLVKDSSEGDKIIYNLRTARSVVEGGMIDGKRSRVSTVLSPRPKKGKSTAPVAPAAGTLESPSRLAN